MTLPNSSVVLRELRAAVLVAKRRALRVCREVQVRDRVFLGVRQAGLRDDEEVKNLRA